MDPDLDWLELLGRGRQRRPPTERMEMREPLSQAEVLALAEEAIARGANDDGDELK